MKIAKKYLDDEKNDEKLLLSDDIEYLKATKEKIEKKVLENKKGNVLVNAFNFFFGAKKEEEKNDELTEEEQEISEEIYQEENLINYLKGNIKANQNAGLSSIIDNIKNIFLIFQ